MIEKCKNCMWYVNDEDEAPDDYKHELALKKGDGFCMLQPLFTYVEPEQKGCSRFVEFYERWR